MLLSKEKGEVLLPVYQSNDPQYNRRIQTIKCFLYSVMFRMYWIGKMLMLHQKINQLLSV